MRYLCLLSIVVGMSVSTVSAEPTETKDPFETGSVEIPSGKLKGQPLNYRLLKPAKIEPGESGGSREKYPIILFLHGAGERGNDNAKQLRHFASQMAKEPWRSKYPCFLLAPQCPARSWWGGPTLDAAEDALLKVIRENPVDTSRVYLTGLSMGGFGSWALATKHPTWFAAVAPICGGGDPKTAYRLVDIPLWAYHGDADKTVKPEKSREMIKAIRAAGGKPNYTELPGVGHNSWTPAYGRQDGLIEWMFLQKRDPDLFPLGGATVLTGPESPLREKERIVFLGDSNTRKGEGEYGFVTIIDQAIAKNRPELSVEVIAKAKISQHITEVHDRFLDAIKARPTVLVIWVGTDDLYHHLGNASKETPKDKYRELLTDMVRRGKKYGATVVLLTPGIKGECPDGKNTLDEFYNAYAQIHRDVAKAEGVTLCDIRRDVQDHLLVHNPTGRSKDVLTRDGLRFNIQGNRVLADRIALAIAEALRQRNAATTQPAAKEK